jgi:hypothetical protein
VTGIGVEKIEENIFDFSYSFAFGFRCSLKKMISPAMTITDPQNSRYAIIKLLMVNGGSGVEVQINRSSTITQSPSTCERSSTTLLVDGSRE